MDGIVWVSSEKEKRVSQSMREMGRWGIEDVRS